MNLQFIDTNILLYAYDYSAGDYHQLASQLVLRLARNRQAAISIQVMQEFYVNATTKIAQPLSHDQAIARLEAFSRWYVYSPLPGDVGAAAQLKQRYQLSFWDAMMLLGAVRLKCDTCWTEDLNAGQFIESVAIRNPFR